MISLLMNYPNSTYSPTLPNTTYRGAVFAVLFNGKEKDYESDLHYYGARYYDSELLTGWLSVDPMADKYPSLSPYNYCAWNPVKLVDPDGEELGDFYDEEGKLIGSDGKNDGKKYLLKMVRPKPLQMDSEADNSYFGIDKKERKKTEDFIRNNDGNTAAFSEDCIAYQNSVLIPTNSSEFVEMRTACKDQDKNVYDVEYGGLKCLDGHIYGGNDGTTPGISRGSRTNVSIIRNRGLSFKYWFHHHLDDRSVYQMPSSKDINTFPDLVGYTISFSQCRIYVTQNRRCQGFITFKGSKSF